MTVSSLFDLWRPPFEKNSQRIKSFLVKSPQACQTSFIALHASNEVGDTPEHAIARENHHGAGAGNHRNSQGFSLAARIGKTSRNRAGRRTIHQRSRISVCADGPSPAWPIALHGSLRSSRCTYAAQCSKGSGKQSDLAHQG